MKKVFYCLLSLLIVITGCKTDQGVSSLFDVYPVDEIYFLADGNTLTGQYANIKVITDPYKWYLWDVSTDKNWCWVSKTSPLNYFKVYAWPNREPIERTATICVTYEEKYPKYIKIRQAGASQLTITPSSPQNISAEGGVIDLTVKSDGEWTVRSDKSWAVIDTEQGVKNGIIRISVNPNQNNMTDQAHISFRSQGVTRELIVNRAANPTGSYININPKNNQKMPRDGGNITISINAKGSWSVSSNKKWAVVETKKGTGNGSTLILVDKNTLNDKEVAAISFNSGTATQKLIIERQCIVYRYIKSASTGKTVYTIDGNLIKEGYSTVYTIDGNLIKEGSSTAYTIDGNLIKEGSSWRVAYTIDGNMIKQGSSSKVVYTLE